MFCDRCGGRCHIEEEFTRIGSVFTLACFECGWRGPIIKDDRVLLNKQGVRDMPTKKGDCVGENCGKKNVSILAKGLCWICYSKIPHKTIKSKDPQRSNGSVKSIPVFVSDGKTSEVVTIQATNTNDVKEILQQHPMKETTSDKTITLTFNNFDLQLYNKLTQSSKKNRRTIENELLFIMDNHYENNQAILS